MALGLAIAAMGFHVADVDDAPGAAGMGLLLLGGAVALGVMAARNRLPTWAARTALAGGVVLASLAAVLTREVGATAPLFPAQREVPSVMDPAPPAPYAAAAERARTLARAAVRQQNLPGLSVAVGAGGAIVWAEGFGWRDLVTRTPVTPDTRFNIGTAAPAVAAASAAIGLDTSPDPAAVWSPEHVGEPEEDPPFLTFIRDVIVRPIGLSAAQPLAGDRATFYIPATAWRGFTDDPRRGRRLMPMRDLACCVNGMAFSSTPATLVRAALSAGLGDLNGTLAGGTVMSLATDDRTGIVVAVTSNIAYADTASLARTIGSAFAETAR